MQAQIDGLLARGSAADPRTRLRVSVAVERQGARFVAHVQLHSPEGSRTRTLGDRDCVVTARAVAFIVASAVDPDLGAGPPLQPQEPEPRATPPPAATKPKVPEPSTQNGPVSANTPAAATASAAPASQEREPAGVPAAARPERRVRSRLRFRRADRPSLSFAFDVHAAAIHQPLPKVALAVLGRAWLSAGDHFRAGAGAGYTAPVREAVPGDPETEVRFDRPFGLLVVCGHSDARRRLAAGGCGSLQVGSNRASGDALTDGIDARVPDVTLALGLWLRRRLHGPLALSSEVSMLLPLLRPRFVVNDREQVHEANAVGFFGSVGLEVAFD